MTKNRKTTQQVLEELRSRLDKRPVGQVGTPYEISLTATYACLHSNAAVNNAKIEDFAKKYVERRNRALSKKSKSVDATLNQEAIS